MSALVLMAAVLAAGQTGKLEITNVRATHWSWGPARPHLKIPLGEAIHVDFDVLGLQPDALQRLRVRTTMEVFDAAGKPIYQPGGVDTVAVDLFATRQLRQSVHLLTGVEQAPGAYRLKVTVLDANAKNETSFTKEFELLPVAFGLVRCQFTGDLEGRLATPAVGVVGQALYLNAAAVGFQRDPKREDRGFVSIELTITDDKDRVLTTQPLAGEANDIPTDVHYVPLRYEIPLQRVGQFKIVLKASDLVSRKTATLTLPIQIVEVK